MRPTAHSIYLLATLIGVLSLVADVGWTLAQEPSSAMERKQAVETSLLPDVVTAGRPIPAWGIWDRMERGDHFYICGDATHMAGDVEVSLLEIIQQQAKITKNDAIAYLSAMEEAGRYQKDIWA